MKLLSIVFIGLLTLTFFGCQPQKSDGHGGSFAPYNTYVRTPWFPGKNVARGVAAAAGGHVAPRWTPVTISPQQGAVMGPKQQPYIWQQVPVKPMTPEQCPQCGQTHYR